MSEITAMLVAARAGDSEALQGVFERVYPELRRLASSRLRAGPGSPTLSPTELVHEVFLRLIGADHLELEHRRHFFACAARAMRLLLIDMARQSSAQKRGGEALQVTFTEGLAIAATTHGELFDLDRALDQLADVNPRAREVVDLRFFAGLTADETAELLGLSVRTVHREWEKARAFLHARLGR
jgi:RNA polymerase sigma factor (TIGR02999 family)